MLREKIHHRWFIVVLILSVVHWHCRLSYAFWLTEMNLLEPRRVLTIAPQASNASFLAESLPATAPNSVAASQLIAQNNNNNQLQATNEQQDQNKRQVQQRALAFSNNQANEGIVIRRNNYRVRNYNQNNQCSCDLTWLRDETTRWLNKWLNNATQSSYQLRLALMSNSTGAQIDEATRRANQISRATSTAALEQSNYSNTRQPDSGIDSRNELYLEHDDKAKRMWQSWPSANLSHLDPALSHSKTITTLAAQNTLQPRYKVNNYTATGDNSSHLKRRHQASAITKTSHTPLVIQGPKGEQGARGERGEPGMSSVKDREALFKLEQQRRQEGQTIIGKLIYLESEQFLVLGTSSGWRQLLLASSPLLDFNRLSTDPSQVMDATKRRTLLNIKQKQAEDPSKTSSSHHRLKSKGPVQSFEPGLGGLARTRANGRNTRWRVDSNDINSMIASNDADDDQANRIDRDDDEDDEEDDEHSTKKLAGEEDDDEDDDDDEEEEEADSLDLGADEDEDDDDNDDDEEEDDDDDEDENESNGDKTMRLQSRTSPPRAGGINGLSNSMFTSQPSMAVSTSTASTNINQKENLSSRRSAASVGSSKQVESIEQHPRIGPQLKLRMIALNEPYSGNLHGIRGADFECKRQAARANIKGSFRSFLSSGGQNLADLVRASAAHKSSIVNLHGEQLASSWGALLRQPSRLANPLSRIYSFDGRHVATDSNWPNKLVWHGAQNKHGLRDPTNNCDGWHSDSLNKMGAATPIHNPRNYGKHKHQQDRIGFATPSGRKARRFLTGNSNGDSNETAPKNNQTGVESQPMHSQSMLALESIDKFPCRMPLILTCIETVAQPIEDFTLNSRNEQSSNLIS